MDMKRLQLPAATIAALVLSLGGLSAAPAWADAVQSSVQRSTDVPLDGLVVRGKTNDAMANHRNNYAHEEISIDGVLSGVSALCGTKGTTAAALVTTDQTRTWNAGTYMSVSTRTLAKHATVRAAPLKNNPNHCEIDGITVKELTGLWR